jgi:hypothetical protein
MTTLTFPIFGFFDVEIRVKPRNAAISDASPKLETARRDLLDQIEHGFTIEDTGARAKVPGFAKTHLKTLVEVDC